MLKNWTIAISSALLALSQVTAAPAATPLTTMRVASKLRKPVHANQTPGDFDRAFIVQQGSLALAFHPDHATNGFSVADYAKASENSLTDRDSVSGGPRNFECRERRGCLPDLRDLNACAEPRRWRTRLWIEQRSSRRRDGIQGMFMRSEVEIPLRSEPAIAKTGATD
jgi:hypothetical protein